MTRYNKDPNPYFLSVIEERFTSSLRHHPSPPSEFKSLDDITVQRIENIILPTSDRNPFRSRTRLRNWLMVELLLHTGMRSGELLNLKVPDIYKDGESYYVRIRQSADRDILSDPRWNKPSIKNIYSIRIVAISKLMFLGFEKYLASGRRKKSSKINYGFLFMSERERPLAQNSLPVVLRRIRNRLNQDCPEAVAITPHSLRHTFVEKRLIWHTDSQSNPYWVLFQMTLG
jgi:integrase